MSDSDNTSPFEHSAWFGVSQPASPQEQICMSHFTCKLQLQLICNCRSILGILDSSDFVCSGRGIYTNDNCNGGLRAKAAGYRVTSVVISVL